MSTAPSPPPQSDWRARARASALPSWSALKAIADAQRLLMVALLVGVLAIPGSALVAGAVKGGGEVAGIVFLVLLIGVRGWMAVATWRLARALGSNVAVLWALGGFLPNFIGLIVLVVLSSRASSRLKKAGVKVGLLGAKLSEKPPPGFLCEELAREFS